MGVTRIETAATAIHAPVSAPTSNASDTQIPIADTTQAPVGVSRAPDRHAR